MPSADRVHNGEGERKNGRTGIWKEQRQVQGETAEGRARQPRQGRQDAGRGHNSGKPAPALVKSHHEKIEAIEIRMAAAKAKHDQIKGEHRSAYAVVKQDGIDVESFKLARELHAQDHGVVLTTYAKAGDYLAAIKSPLATQMDLFQSLEVPLPVDAKLAGTHAFSNKEPRTNNPFQQGTEEFVEWDGAWMAAGDKVDLSADDGATKH